MKFKDLIAPISQGDFRRLIVERPEYKLWRSTMDMKKVFGWKDLEVILRQQRINNTDVAVLRNGARISMQETTEKTSRRFKVVNQLHSGKIAEILQNGGTIRIAHIDEKSDNLESIASEIENVFGNEVNMNLYAGFGFTQALPAHSDTHDILVIQLEGRKSWQIFGFGADPYPIKLSENKKEICPSKLIWSGELEKGDLIFMPRGSWHQVKTVGNVSSLHVSIGFNYIMLHELHLWLTKKLAKFPFHNKHLLEWDTGGDDAVEANVRSALNEILIPGFLSQYRKDRKSSRISRFNLTLPH